VIRAGRNVRWSTLVGSGGMFLPFLRVVKRWNGTVFSVAERLDRIDHIVAGG
jgi:hypothetical protein